MADDENTEEVTVEEEEEVTQPAEEEPEAEVPQPEEEAPEPEEPEVQPEEPPSQLEEPPSQPKPKPVPVFEDEHGRSEAEVRMELEKKKRSEREADEWKEYEEMRKAEREASEREINELRERRERRRAERAEEERRLAELRQAEEQKRRAEEEERQRRKREEIERKKEEREQKMKEAEERMRNAGKRNFVITKLNADGGTVDRPEGDYKGEIPAVKSKEQLEAEKKAILAQRIQPLNSDGLNMSQLKEKAQELFNLIFKLTGDKFDLEEQYKAQQIDMMSLQEKARQMVKGGKGKEKTLVQSTENDPLSEKIAGIPPKVLMYSRYERLKDRRTFTERRDLFTGPSYLDTYEQLMKPKKTVEESVPKTERKKSEAKPEEEAEASEEQETAAAEETEETVEAEVEVEAEA